MQSNAQTTTSKTPTAAQVFMKGPKQDTKTETKVKKEKVAKPPKTEATKAKCLKMTEKELETYVAKKTAKIDEYTKAGTPDKAAKHVEKRKIAEEVLKGKRTKS